ncbi:MAG: trypsin-like peptidase domain-containing protein [Chloroflexi bacterium]|nr:trypsin-like peptidase domain-containing protein [Chloroflexota bacterium]
MNFKMEDFGTRQYTEQTIAAQVCCIELNLHPDGIQPQQGTGFLIAPDLILTNYHVVQYLFNIEDKQAKGESWAWPEDVTIYFDRFTNPIQDKISNGLPFTLAKNWAIEWSKHSLMDTHGESKLKPISVEELDYAILRLADPVGMQNLIIENENRRRGWIGISELSYAYKQDEELLIFQYPIGMPLQIARGKVTRSLNETRTRIYYQVDANYGSSGAPCFNSNWELIAIHRRRIHEDGRENEREGIPISAVANRQKLLDRPFRLLVSESEKHAAGITTKNLLLPTTSELIAKVYDRFEYVPQRILQTLLDEVGQSSLGTDKMDFRIWLQQLVQLRTQPDRQTWTYMCLEFHLGVNNMNYDLSAFRDCSPFLTVRFIYSVNDSLMSHLERLQTLEPEIRYAPPDVQLDSINDARATVDSIRKEILQTLVLFAKYDLRIAGKVAESNKALIQCLNRLSNGMRRSSRFSSGQRSRGTTTTFQVSDNLQQLEIMMKNYIDWLIDLTSEAEIKLQTIFSDN